MAIKFIENQNQISNDKIGRTKKITGTRFAAILGKNKWQTPFEIWCDMTKTFAKPFVETIYTEAGKHIEPLQVRWYIENYFANVITPEQRYGFDPFKKTYGDFFRGLKGGSLSAGKFDDPKDDVLGGMWDAIEVDENGKPIGVIECKSTKNASDWGEEEAPEYYEYQAALYAYLMGLDKVTMVVTFLDEEDYHGADNKTTGDELWKALDKMKSSLKVNNDNTKAFSFYISERYPDFDKTISYALDWHERHVKGKISPPFDMSTRDKDIVRQLTTAKIADPNTDISKIAMECDELEAEINMLMELNGISHKEKELKLKKEELKELALTKFGEQDNYVEIRTGTSCYTVAKQSRTSIDSKKLEADGLLEVYQVTKESIVLRKGEK